jgi:predicted nucleic acid-binding protein
MLVDTTVWVDHLRRGDAVLADLLEELQVSAHPFVVGELACGRMRNRDRVLTAVGHLPTLRDEGYLARLRDSGYVVEEP